MPASSIDLQQVARGFQNQVFSHLDNFVNQTLITTNLGRGNLQKMYTRMVENTVANMISGNLTHAQALKRVVQEQVARGIPSSFIDKGGNLWSIERYMNMVLRSTYNRTYNEIRMERMADFDVHTVLVSALDDPAPRCSEVQGTVVDMRENPPTNEFRSIYDFGYGEPGGTLGINCRHMIWPFIPGVNTNNQEQIPPELSEERYRDRLRQRELERRADRTRDQLSASRELGSDDVGRLERQLRRQNAELDAHVEEIKEKKVNFDRGLGYNIVNEPETNASVKRKVETYLLDKNHQDGGTKAKWFDDALSLNHSNSEKLVEQLVFNSHRSVEEGDKGHGMRYSQIISITGANSRVMDAKVIWIKNKEDGKVRLVTAYPNK